MTRTGPWTVVIPMLVEAEVPPTGRPGLKYIVCDTEVQLGEVLASHPGAMTFAGRVEPLGVSAATQTVVLWGKP